MDDVYTIATRDRAAEITAHVAKCIKEDAGIEPKLGKFAMRTRNGGPEPPGVDDFLDGQPRPAIPLWKSNLAPADNGAVILGTPIGSKESVARILKQRLTHQKHLLRLHPRVPHLQSAWLLFLY